MRQWIRAHLTYANVIATLALFLVLSGGTAVALKGSNTVFSDDIVDNQVGSADVRNDSLSGGGLTAADLRPDSVGSSEVKQNSLTGANVDESRLGAVPNSNRLGGLSASNYQRRVTGSCNGGGAIQAIRGNGGVSCSKPAVFPISADLSTNGGQSTDESFGFGPSRLGLYVLCGSSSASAQFVNNGSDGATLNWLFSQGGTASSVNASGTSLAGFPQGGYRSSFNFANRLEGQWIFADAAGVTTVNLHAFYLPGSPAFCEFKGTAEFAPNS